MSLKDATNNRFRHTEKDESLGYTDRFEKQNKRVLNKDGTFNVIRKGVKTGVFHTLLSMSWLRFAMFILLFYVGINLLFASLYVSIDFNGIGYTEDYEVNNRFLIALFFSAQTLTTVGYGSLYPLSSIVSTIAATEALIGLMGFAIFTGLMYGRFARPVHGFKFSHRALIAPFKDGLSLQFRVANEMTNNLLEIEARALLSMVVTEGKRQVRRFHPLKLEINKIDYLTINWTVVHPLNEESPLYGMNEQDFQAGNTEIIIMMKGFNDTFGQEVHARTSYTWMEIDWHRKFKLPYYFNEEGITVFELEKLEEAEEISATA